MKDTSKYTSRPYPKKVKEKSLFLINDNHNSFDYVVDCLVSLCDHEPIQAEQCALITHYKGACNILSGLKSDLELVKDDLILYGLDVDIL